MVARMGAVSEAHELAEILHQVEVEGGARHLDDLASYACGPTLFEVSGQTLRTEPDGNHVRGCANYHVGTGQIMGGCERDRPARPHGPKQPLMHREQLFDIRSHHARNV